MGNAATDNSAKGMADAIKHRLAEKQRKDSANQAWEVVREDSRTEVVKAEEEKGAVERAILRATYGRGLSEPPPAPDEFPILLTIAWTFSAMGVLFALVALVFMQERADILLRGSLDERFFNGAVPVIAGFTVSVAAFEFAFRFHTKSLEKRPRKNLPQWYLAGGLFTVFALCVLTMLALLLVGTI